MYNKPEIYTTGGENVLSGKKPIAHRFLISTT